MAHNIDTRVEVCPAPRGHKSSSTALRRSASPAPSAPTTLPLPPALTQAAVVHPGCGPIALDRHATLVLELSRAKTYAGFQLPNAQPAVIFESCTSSHAYL